MKKIELMELKKILFKVFTTVLALVLAVSAVLPVFGHAEDGINRDVPEIFVHGFMASTVLSDRDDPDSPSVIPSTEDILGAVKKAVPALSEFMLTRNYEKLGKAIVPLAADIIGSLVLDPSGEPIGNSGLYYDYPSADEIDRSTKIKFRYDWRLDPIQTAGELNEFIDYILDASGADQVVLHGHSFGGVVMTTYFRLYGYSKVRSVCYDTTAVFGETYTGELLTGEIVLDADAIREFMLYVFDYSEYQYLLDSIMDILRDAGLLGFISRLGNKLVDGLSPYVMPEIVAPIFAGWPSIWAMTPDEKIEPAMDYVFNDIYKDSPIDRSGLIAKIERYNSTIRPYKQEVLQTAAEKMNLYVISRYGYPLVPITPSYDTLSDGVIDTARSSFGAVTAKLNETLSDEYIASRDPGYVSPDRTVDASTCLFPDRTWLIGGFKHSDTNASFENMIDTLLYHDGQATVDTYGEYPRFMRYDAADNSVKPDGQQSEVGLLVKLYRIIVEIFKLIKSIFTK